MTKAGGTSSVLLQDSTGVQSKQSQSQLSTHSGYSKCGCRSFEQSQETTIRIKDPKKILQSDSEYLGTFAYRHIRSTTQLPTARYWSLIEDPFAEKVNAFDHNWRQTGLYMYPPQKLIPKVLQKMKRDRTREAVLVTPNWPTQFWYPTILQMRHLATPIVWHISNKWQLIAWQLSTTKINHFVLNRMYVNKDDQNFFLTRPKITCFI